MMSENVICRAKLEAAQHKKGTRIGLILFVIIAVIGLIFANVICDGEVEFSYYVTEYNRSGHFFATYAETLTDICTEDHEYESRFGYVVHYDAGDVIEVEKRDTDWFLFWLSTLVEIGVFLVLLSPKMIALIGKFISSRCSLTLEEGQIKGQLKALFGKKSLQLPLDHLDNVMISHGLMDKLRGGKTLLISSNRSLIKFHYVQNADEFARVAMEKIEEVKKKTFHNPAPAPTATPAQPTGNDTMEKLNSLKKMLENGLITPDEYAEKRKEILGKL